MCIRCCSRQKRLEEKVDWMVNFLGGMNARIGDVMDNLDALTAQAAKNEEVEASALVVINGIAARIAAAGTDPVKLQALTDGLKTSADALSAAIVANTPAA